MLARLVHAAIAFVVTGALYLAYVALVVPVVEPPATVPVAVAPQPGQSTRGAEAVAQYQEFLSAYFPQPNHWTRQAPPEVFENEQLMVVTSGLEETNDGRLHVQHCALLMFPTPRQRGVAPPRDAIIMLPAGGAVLEGKRRPGVAASSFDKLERAWLRGEVKIHSDMREPGKADDLDITTHEIYIRQDLVRTDQRVEMRLGPHFGGGRGLEIKLLDSENPIGGAKLDPLAGRFESLEISDQVELQIAPGELSLPGDESRDPAAGPEPPIRITSAGPFRIDFGNYVASFTDQVLVRQVHAGGEFDEVKAQELNLNFARLKKKKTSAVPSTSSPLGAGFELASIELKGAPVNVDAPGRQAKVECARMFLELRKQAVTIQGENNKQASFAYRGAEINAPQVYYAHPPKESGQAIGPLVASGGGSLKAIVDRRRPDEPLDVRWTESLKVDRVDGAPILTIRGRTWVTLGSLGKLSSDGIEMLLVERPVDPAQAVASELPWPVVAKRIRAAGNVSVDSPELVVRGVEQMQVDVDYAKTKPAAPGLTGPDGSGGSGAAGGQLNPLARLGRAARRTYRVTGKRLALQAKVRDGKTDVADVAIDGGVIFEEAPDVGKEAPLRVEAERVVVKDADTPQAKIDIFGRPAAAGATPQLAQITARGATLRAPEINIIRGRSQVQIESPGEVVLLSDRDLTGKPLMRPEPLTITWQKWMRLDRDRLIFRGDVECKNATGWLRTPQLGATLSQEVNFDGATAANRTDIVQLDCAERVVAEFDERDDAGITSHQRIELASILVNQQTGVIAGRGPGMIESVHLSTGKGMIAAAAPGAAPQYEPPAPHEPGQKLRHLRVDFISAVEGNLRERRVTLVGDVQAVYGPVDSWEQRLRRRIGARPDPNVVQLTCDRLTVAESPLARASRPAGSQGLAELELIAESKVQIEGEVPDKGMFTATGNRASYDAFKSMFVLRGDAVGPAKLYRQRYVGGPVDETVAERIAYNTRTGELDGEFYKFDWTQFEVSSPPATTQQR